MLQAMLGGMSARSYLSAGMAAMPANSEGVPFDASHVYASGVSGALIRFGAHQTGKKSPCSNATQRRRCTALKMPVRTGIWSRKQEG
jgi:hypothetical protein